MRCQISRNRFQSGGVKLPGNFRETIKSTVGVLVSLPRTCTLYATSTIPVELRYSYADVDPAWNTDGIGVLANPDELSVENIIDARTRQGKRPDAALRFHSGGSEDMVEAYLLELNARTR